MSYELEVLKDMPNALYMMDGNTVDSTGRNVNAVVAGTQLYGTAPLVAGAKNSTMGTPGTYVGFPTNKLAKGFRGDPFSVEMWINPTPSASPCPLFGHSTKTDGLYWLPGYVIFSIELETSGVVSVSYKIPYYQNLHVVGIYTGESISIWVDGVPRQTLALTEDQMKEDFVVHPSPGAMYLVNNAIAVQAIATYNRILSAREIKNHYAAGTNIPDNHSVHTLYGGTPITVSEESADVGFQHVFNTNSDWSGPNTTSTCQVSDTIKSPVDENGDYIAAYWKTAIPLDSISTNLNGIMPYVESEGVSIQTSYDDVTWSTLNNATVISGSVGLDTAGKKLYVKVNFTAGTYGEVKSMRLVAYNSNKILNRNRTITLPTAYMIFEESPLMEYRFTGELVISSGSLVIGPDSSGSPVQSLSFWYQSTSGTIAINQTPIKFYENGNDIAQRTVVGGWRFVTYTFASTTGPIQITGPTYIRDIVLYDQQLTQAQVKNIYAMYTGNPVKRVDAAGTITVNNPEASIYANTWSFTGAG